MVADGELTLKQQKARGKVTKDNVVLPPLAWNHTPNQSDRILGQGIHPYLVVVHRPVGSYHSAMAWLDNPKAKASGHVVTEGNFTKADEATQLVAWDKKAWACMAFNSVSYNLEIDDDAWFGRDPEALLVAMRIAGFLCHKTGIPPRLSGLSTHVPGIISHFMLGRAGGSHTDPTEDHVAMVRFARGVEYQVNRGGFRKAWGKGTLKKI